MRRWRFEFHDSYEDPQYVEAETEEEAWTIFRRNWDGYIESAKEAGCDLDEIDKIDENTKVREVGLADLKWAPRPTCCDEINAVREWDSDGPSVRLRLFRGSYEEPHQPRWALRGSGMDVSFCPFCGTKLPEVERMENPPQPIWDGDDYYCGTCNERNMCCECNPPWAGYRIVK